MVKSRRVRWAGHVAPIILMEKPEGKREVGSPRHRCVDNIKMNVREVEWGGIDWFDLTQVSDQWRALVNTVMNLRVL
jgi:hypothetical protein